VHNRERIAAERAGAEDVHEVEFHMHMPFHAAIASRRAFVACRNRSAAILGGERPVHDPLKQERALMPTLQTMPLAGEEAMKKTLLALAAAAATLTALPVAPVLGDPPPWAPAHGRRAQDRDDDRRYDDRRYEDRRYDDRRYRERRYDTRYYDSRGRYLEPRRISRNSYVWRGNDGRYYCKRDNGTTGLIIGAGVGALAGHSIAGRGDRTLGAVLGGVLGGVLGREIDRGSIRCR
jgi:hypothetical protein